MKEKELIITRDNQKIYGKLLIPDTEKEKYPIVILAHGFSSNYESLFSYAKEITKNGFITYTFDFIGGSNKTKSDGKTTEMSVMTEVEDLKTITQYFKNQNYIDENNIFLLGASQGGLVTALTSAQIPNNIKAQILLYPGFSIIDEVHSNFKKREYITGFSLWDVNIGEKYSKDIWNLDAYSEATKYTKPTLIIHGTIDKIVDIKYSRKANREYSNSILIEIENAPHGFKTEEHFEKAIKEIILFLKKNI